MSHQDTKVRLLLVEDNVDTAWGLAELLKVLGYEVDTAYDVDSGLSLLRSNPPNAVLCDINLGSDRPSGYDFAQSVRDDPVLGRTPLISLSGYGQPRHFVKSKEAGFDQHIVKPASVEKLDKTLRMLTTTE